LDQNGWCEQVPIVGKVPRGAWAEATV